MSTSYNDTAVTTNVNGRSMHSNELGQGETLIAMHGGGPGANAWDNTKRSAAALAEHFRVILLDLPGYGHSEAIDALAGETQDRMYARAITSFMDARGIDRAHLFGASMSCGPVMRLALDHPDRVIKLMLKSPGFGAPNLLSVSPPDGIRALGVFRANPTHENMEKMLELFVPNAELRTQEMVDSRFASAMHAIETARPVTEALPSSYLLPEVGQLQMPTLVLWGNQDRMVPLDGALLAIAAIPNVRVHIWGNRSGHFVEWEHVEEFNRLATNFLRFD